MSNAPTHTSLHFTGASGKNLNSVAKRRLRTAVDIKTSIWVRRSIARSAEPKAGNHQRSCKVRKLLERMPKSRLQQFFRDEASCLSRDHRAKLLGSYGKPSKQMHRTEFAMVETGAIGPQQSEQAKAHPASLHYSVDAGGIGGWFADWAAREAREATSGFEGTIRVKTTLDQNLQQVAERIVKQSLDANASLNVHQGALVAMKPDGRVVAMVGGRDYRESQYNRAVQALRPAGSTFKLFVYLAALRQGVSPHDVVEDSPLQIGNWEPENYGGNYKGAISVAEAFASSSNAVAVRLGQRVGPSNIVKVARDLGISTPVPSVPSIALGSADVSLLELTASYAAVLSDNAPVKPWTVQAFTPAEPARSISLGPPASDRRSLGPSGEGMLELLKGVIDNGTGRSAKIDGTEAGKTGTSQDYRDAWFIGFHGSLIVGVWVGSDDRSPMKGVTGGSLPASIWRQFITEAYPPTQR